ncbi:MAG: cytochrome c-type biogenesis protein [Methylococcaceae bacterium]
MKKLLFCLFLLSQSVHAEIEVYQFTTPELELRYQTLTEELRCLVCQNQNIADSHAELAQDLRRKVYEMLNRGETNPQIIDYMTERYGDFVLYRPPFNVKTLILWLAPILTLLMGGIGFWSLLKRRDNSNERLSDSERARLDKLLHTKKSDSK